MRKADGFLKRAMSVIVTGAMVLSIMPATIYAQGEAAEVETVNEAVAEAGEGLKFVTMNVPYRDFYETLGVEVDNKDYCYDTVSTATTRFFYTGSGTSKGTYSEVERDDEGTVTGGNILGVTYPVAMTEADYSELQGENKTAEENYYFKDYEGTPDSYMTVSYDDGKYTFSTDTIKENSANELEVINFTTEADYGDYQIELKGLYPQKIVDEETTLPGVVIGDKSNLSISGVILTTDDGKKYGMGMLENTWVGTRRDWVEIAWSVPEGNGLTNHGGAQFKTFDTNGKTLKEVQVITDQGRYTIPCEVKLTEFYSGEEQVAAEITDAQTLQISVPTAFQNPKVTVSYKSGRSVVNVAEDAQITDGKVALKDIPETETTYSVKVTSDNYAPKIITVTYGTKASGPVENTGITDAQKTQLNEYIVLGSILVKGNPGTTTLLAAHIQEARELLEKEDATSEDADELIGELAELIEEAQKNASAPVMKYVTMNMPYRDFYETLGVEVDNEKYCYDTVSTATTRFFYTGSGTSKGTYSRVELDDEEKVKGGDILGVTYPVAMIEADYNLLKEKVQTAEDNYYFKDYEGTPDSYMTMVYNEEDGSYGFTTATIKENSIDGLEVEVINFTTEADYGDYQIELKGLYPQKIVDEETTLPGVVIGDKSNLSISGVILTTDDGKKYGMGMLENTWVGTRRDWVEIAWSVPEGNGLTNHGGAKFKTFDTNGKTLKEVQVITDQGSYTIPCAVKLTEFYSGEEQVEAEIIDAQTLQISVPTAFQNPKVTVSYKSGRSVVNVAEDAQITDGKVALKDIPETETTYSVKVTSDNYAPKIKTITYGIPVEDTGITEAQKEKLAEYIAKGTSWVEYDSSLTLLAAHIQEAKELLEKTDATSEEAEELIGELEELIEEAEQKHPGVTPGTTTDDTTTDDTTTGDTTTDTDNTNTDNTNTDNTNTDNTSTDKTTTDNKTVKQASKVTLKNKTVTYTGKAIAIAKATVTGSKGAITYKYYSDKKCTKTVAAAKVKNAGTYYVKATVAADNNYNSATSNVATLKIKKAAQTIKGATTSKTIKSTKLKKAAQSFSIGAKATSGKVTYSKTSGNKKIKVSANGKVKVAKGLKKGTYKIKVKIKAKATTNYAAKTQTKTIKIKVK